MLNLKAAQRRGPVVIAVRESDWYAIYSDIALSLVRGEEIPPHQYEGITKLIKFIERAEVGREYFDKRLMPGSAIASDVRLAERALTKGKQSREDLLLIKQDLEKLAGREKLEDTQRAKTFLISLRSLHPRGSGYSR